MQSGKKVLVMSVGFGMGHHAAARAVAEELERRGCSVLFRDPCEATGLPLYELTRRFYRLCVRRLPWLWGVTYEQTDNSDWRRMLWLPGLAACVRRIEAMLEEYRPDACVCSYPLFAHMLDALNSTRRHRVPYALVVTDALEISRPWATSCAPLVCVPDTASRELLMSRYGMEHSRIVATGFPVRRVFACAERRCPPSTGHLRILYGVFVPPAQVRSDVRALMQTYPQAHVVLVAGERRAALEHLLREFPERLELLGQVEDMQPLFAAAHLYIGKAGAATLFEAYASGLPVIINYALPGQEQGNLELLLSDGAGFYAEGTEALLQTLAALMQAGAALWSKCSAAMRAADRARGAENIVNEMEDRFL